MPPTPLPGERAQPDRWTLRHPVHFAQALTEAAAAVPNVVVLVSIPASDIEVGGDKGQDALARLRNVVRRKSAQWRPAEDDESFEMCAAGYSSDDPRECPSP